MQFPNLRRIGIPILALLLVALLIGPAAGVRAQEGGPATGDTASQPQAPAAALGTAFTYQGRLTDGGNPANGAYDFQFKLFDAATGGTQIGGTVSKNDLPVSGGLFTTDLDFGNADHFYGQARWLEMAVRSGASTGAYTTLAPRRALLAAPYSLYSLKTNGIYFYSSGIVDISGRVRADDFRIRDSSAAADMRLALYSNETWGFTKRNGSRGAGLHVGGLNVGFDYTPVSPAIDSTGRVLINGNVGIGTTSPEYALDMVGERLRLSQNGNSLILDASNPGVEIQSSTGKITFWSGGAAGFTTLDAGILQARTATTVLNPANGSASVDLDWKDNVARIRIGGNGAGANNGLDIQGVGDVSLLRVRADGTTSTRVLEIRGGSDLAEPFAITDRPEPGLVVAIDPDHIGQLRIADKAYDRTVAGVISGAGGLQPGLTMQQPEVVQGEAHPVALTGRVYVWADASFGAIQPGDLLTTSATPGHAMRVSDYALAQGAILGKAMSWLAEGTGLVLVLVSLQ